jgi:hypothetical protein
VLRLCRHCQSRTFPPSTCPTLRHSAMWRLGYLLECLLVTPHRAHWFNGIVLMTFFRMAMSLPPPWRPPLHKPNAIDDTASKSGGFGSARRRLRAERPIQAKMTAVCETARIVAGFASAAWVLAFSFFAFCARLTNISATRSLRHLVTAVLERVLEYQVSSHYAIGSQDR